MEKWPNEPQHKDNTNKFCNSIEGHYTVTKFVYGIIKPHFPPTYTVPQKQHEYI